MPIAAVQEGGNSAGVATSVARVFSSNVTRDNKILLGLWIAIATGSDDPIVTGDISISGTATLGAWTLHAQTVEVGGSFNSRCAVLSSDVTGTGSLTVTFGSQPAGSYLGIGAGEYSGVGGVIGTNVANANSGSTAVDSGNVTLSGGGIIFGVAKMGPDALANLTITPDAAFTTVFEMEDVNFAIGSSIRRLNTGALTDSASWTTGAGCEWAAAVVAFSQAAPRALGSMGAGR